MTKFKANCSRCNKILFNLYIFVYTVIKIFHDDSNFLMILDRIRSKINVFYQLMVQWYNVKFGLKKTRSQLSLIRFIRLIQTYSAFGSLIKVYRITNHIYIQ